MVHVPLRLDRDEFERRMTEAAARAPGINLSADTSTLTEFLSARLDEDEATFSAPVAFPGEFGISAEFLATNGVNGLYWDHDGSLQGVGPRMLTEVAAKRAMIADLDGYCYANHGGSAPCGVCDRVGCRNLRRMASVYADHPAFNPEWRAHHD